MTLEEACLYLGISPDDDDLDLDQMERNYNAKRSIYDLKRFNPDTPEYREARRIRAEIEEAHEYMLDVYEQLYGEDDSETENHEDKFMKLAVLMAGIFLLCFGGVVYFVYSIRIPDISRRSEAIPKQEYASHSEDYENLKKEIEQLKARANMTQTTQNNLPDYSKLVERLSASMIYIEADKGNIIGTGSGFLVSSNGNILTNYHVIQGARRIRISSYGGNMTEARVKDFNADKDIALLKADVSGAYLTLSSSLPKQGERVIAISNPRGFQGTVSDGIVSAYRRDNGGNLWMQFTAPVSPGSSGGALFNMQGEVVGMPTMLRTDGQNLNFAVPSTVLKEFLAPDDSQ